MPPWSTSSIPPTTQRPPQRWWDMPIWLIIGYSLILLFSILGNLLVISTLTQNRRMRSITNVFLLNLAISDMLLGMVCMPVTLVGTLLRNFIFGEFFCKLIQFSQAASVAVSSWTLVAISCERYYAICHPLRSRRWQTRKHAYKIILGIWLGSFVCMTPIAAFSRLMPTSRLGYHKCREDWPDFAEPYERPYNIFLDIGLLILPVVMLSVAYILIIRTLYVGMAIEKAMIFGESYSGSGKLFSDDIFGQPFDVEGGNKFGMSALSRFKLKLKLRRQGYGGHALDKGRKPNLHSKIKGKGQGSNNTDTNIQETDIFEQQQEQQQQQQQQQQHHPLGLGGQQKSYHHHQIHNSRIAYQQQNPCHNYPQHQQMFVQSNNDEEGGGHHQQTDRFNKLSCDNMSRLCCGGKRGTHSSGGGNNGRRHLYCMRFATLKPIPDESINCSECCSSSSSGGYAAGNTPCGYNCNSCIGHLPSSSGMSAASTSASAAYRYQMQQQQCSQCNHAPNPYAHHPHNRNFSLQQVTPNVYTRKDGKKFINGKRILRASDSVLRRNNMAKNLESKRRVVKMLAVLVAEFFICWTPLYTINTVAMYIGPAIYEYVDYRTISVLQLLAYSSSCCNPITYCFMNASFRRSFLDTFKGKSKWFGKRDKQKRSAAQNKNLGGLAGNSSVRGNSSTIHTVVDSPRL